MFTRGGPADANLYRASADGAELVQLTDFNGFEHSPTWSPDGSGSSSFGDKMRREVLARLASCGWSDPMGPIPLFSSTKGSATPPGHPTGNMSRSNSVTNITSASSTWLPALSRIWRAGYVPKWSPDGPQLAFIADRGDGLDVFVLAVYAGDRAG